MSDSPFNLRKKNAVAEKKASEEALNNYKPEKPASMTFLAPRDWHAKFKITAVQNGMSMHELFFECFEAWQREKARNEAAKDE